MGFLGFLKKKKKDTTGSELEMPLLPKAGEGEAELPSFPEQEPLEDLRLPEIPELEQPTSESLDMPELPPQEAEQPDFEIAPEPPEGEPEMIKPELTLPEELILPEEPEHESMEDAYKYTPAEPHIEDMEKNVPEFPKREMEIASFSTGARREVFIRGDDYRNLMEGLEAFIRKEKEKRTKQERDIFRIEEREYERFMKIVEDLQRNLIITENNMFE